MRERVFDLPGCRRNHPNQGQVYEAIPDSSKGDRAPVLLALHGSGREATSYRDVQFYRTQRDLALESGYHFLAISNGPDGWGLDDGLENIFTLYEYVSATLAVNPRWVFWGTSAGGAMMFRIVHARGEIVRGVIGTFPVYDLIDAFHNSAGCGKAWSARTEPELRSRLGDGRNPPDLLESLVGREYLLFHGRDDAILDPQTHSGRFRDEANPQGGSVKLVLTPGGHSTENHEVYNRSLIARYLRRWRSPE